MAAALPVAPPALIPDTDETFSSCIQCLYSVVKNYNASTQVLPQPLCECPLTLESEACKLCKQRGARCLPVSCHSKSLLIRR